MYSTIISSVQQNPHKHNGYSGKFENKIWPFHSQEWSISNFPCSSLTRDITSHSMENFASHSLPRTFELYLSMIKARWLAFYVEHRGDLLNKIIHFQKSDATIATPAKKKQHYFYPILAPEHDKCLDNCRLLFLLAILTISISFPTGYFSQLFMLCFHLAVLNPGVEEWPTQYHPIAQPPQSSLDLAIDHHCENSLCTCLGSATDIMG